jgi:hypothetical protein
LHLVIEPQLVKQIIERYEELAGSFGRKPPIQTIKRESPEGVRQ